MSEIVLHLKQTFSENKLYTFEETLLFNIIIRFNFSNYKCFTERHIAWSNFR